MFILLMSAFAKVHKKCSTRDKIEDKTKKKLTQSFKSGGSNGAQQVRPVLSFDGIFLYFVLVCKFVKYLIYF